MGTRWFEEDVVKPKWPYYTRANIGEVFPDTITPATYHLIYTPGDRGWQMAFKNMGVMHRDDVGEDEFLIVGLFGGYGYVNLSYLRMAGVRAPGSSADAIDVSLFGDGSPPEYSAEKGHKRPLNTLKMVRYVTKVLGRDAEPPFVEESRKRLAEFQAKQPSLDASDEELLAYMYTFPEYFKPQFCAHMQGTITGSILTGMLSDGAEAAGRPDLMLPLTAAVGEVDSANISGLLGEAAEIARTTPSVAAEFDQGIDGIAERLAANADAAAFRAAFDRFMARYGHRGPNDWELACLTYENTPALAYAAVNVMRNAEAKPARETNLTDIEAARTEAAAIIRPHLGFPDKMNFDKAVRVNRHYVRAREMTRDLTINMILPLRHAFFELARRAQERGGTDDLRSVAMLHPYDELPKYLADPAPFVETLKERAALHARFEAVEPPFFITSPDDVPTIEMLEAEHAKKRTVQKASVGTTLEGVAGSSGVARGRARVILDAGDPAGLEPGDILIAPITDPTWTPLFLPAAAVVVNLGALMSHAVVVARELGIPCVVSVDDATDQIPDGALIEVDGAAGTVTIIEDA